MADTFTLRVLTPQRELADETVEQVTAEGALGQFGVLADHVTFLTALEPGPLTIKKPGGGQETIAVEAGYAEVKDHVMTVLADDAMPVSQIDASRARTDLEESKAALDAASYEDADRARLAQEVRWAEVRVELAAK